MIPENITYKIIERSSFKYNKENEFKCPPDFAVEALSEMLCDDEVSALRETMDAREMGFVDVMMIHTFCIVAQKEQITPLQFTDKIGVQVPPQYFRGFQRVGDAWQAMGIIPKQDHVPTTEELDSMWNEV
tara:strand:- start:144 stop:533 length:390 start_codon:yes stop_codon:yes gene_type:complete